MTTKSNSDENAKISGKSDGVIGLLVYTRIDLFYGFFFMDRSKIYTNLLNLLSINPSIL